MEELTIKEEGIEDGEFFSDIILEEDILHPEETSQEVTENYYQDFDQEMKIEKHAAEEAANYILLPDNDESGNSSDDSDHDESLVAPQRLGAEDDLQESASVIQQLADSIELELEGESDTDFRWSKKEFEHPEDIQWKDSMQVDDAWSNLTPLEFFKIIFDENLFKHITDQTNMYALQSKGQELGLKISDLKTYLGILIKFGLMNPPSYTYFWKKTSRYSIIADSLSRDKFVKIKSVIHFNDNTKILPRGHPEHDKLFRVRPIIEGIRSNLLQIPQEEHQAIDEQMIPTKAHSSLKQYMPKKTLKWGYKAISRAGASGFVYDFIIYTGKDCICDNKNIGIPSAYVLKLIENLPRNKNYKIYFDNWFSSLPLVRELNELGILFLATVRPNRLRGLKLRDEKDLKKEGRGSLDYSVEQTTNCIAIKWYDNKPVHLISNYAGIGPTDTCSRWDAKQNARVQIPRPFAVIEYNKYIGGVDLTDMLIELYRINFKSQKWYMRIFVHLLDLSVVNSWILYRRTMEVGQHGGKILSLLDFREDVAAGLMSSSTKKEERPSTSREPVAKKRRMGCHPADSVRLDELSHWPGWTDKPQRCKHCIKKHTIVQCQKCNVNLCFSNNRNCFTDYHSK